MKLWLNGLGVLLGAMGIVWMLQGTGALPYGAMANQIQWAFLGEMLEVWGVGLLVVANLRGAART